MNDLIFDDIPDISFTVELVCTNKESIKGFNKDDFIVTASGEIGKEISLGVFEFIFD